MFKYIGKIVDESCVQMFGNGNFKWGDVIDPHYSSPPIENEMDKYFREINAST